MAHTVYGLSPSGRKTCTTLKVNGASGFVKFILLCGMAVHFNKH